MIDRVFPFEEALDAASHLASGAHFGKVVITHLHHRVRGRPQARSRRRDQAQELRSPRPGLCSKQGVSP
ncbi:zinc-binding dehydrogenase [Streptomyces sp. NBC_01231]|nr:zinc-binding dehydrogenase [Streptomyces sp. NBC_01231]